jgi:hypothetical protein
MGQSCLPTRLQKDKDMRLKVRHHDHDLEADRNKMGTELEHNAAVDYAIRKSSQRENYFVIELMISCQNLPDYSRMERASTFAVLHVDVNSLDDHDKKVIGGVQDEELDCYANEEEKEDESILSEDYVADWFLKKVTEV